MNRVVNSLALVLALATSIALTASYPTAHSDSSQGPEPPSEPPSEPTPERATPEQALEPTTPARIASATSLADQVLAEIANPEQVIAISARTTEGPAQWRLGTLPRIESLENIEQIISLRPQRLIVSSLSAARPVARLRESGIDVIDLGEMRGMDTLRPDILAVADAIEEHERGAVLADRIEREFANRRTASVPRIEGLFVGTYAGRMFGGAARTSYHDVLDAAGIDDIAARSGHEGWPEYSAEQLLVMDPDWLVSPTDDPVCELQNVQALRACAEGHVLRVDADLLGDPGLRMLDAANALRDAVDAAL